jgi:hypothetical protein
LVEISARDVLGGYLAPNNVFYVLSMTFLQKKVSQNLFWLTFRYGMGRGPGEVRKGYTQSRDRDLQNIG